MEQIFLFNSPPRSGNVFFTHIFSMFIDQECTKCLDIKKYSDKTQKQAAFFRNPYDAIPSTVVKSRIDQGIGFDDIDEVKNDINAWAGKYLEAIIEAKANSSNLYLGKSEDFMSDPISTLKDIALFFGFTLNNDLPTNEQVIKTVEERLWNTQRSRVDKFNNTIVETLMSGHDGHMPREKISERLIVDKLIQEFDFKDIQECYNKYMSLESTNAASGQRWFESSSIPETDAMGREKFWQDLGRPENDGLALKMFKEQCCDQCTCNSK